MGMKKFKVKEKCAAHYDHETGVTTPAGGIVESELDLDKLFVNKFVRVHGKGNAPVEDEEDEVTPDENKAAVEKAAKDAKKKAPAKKTEPEPEEEDASHEDVTHQFKKAADNDLTVVKTDDGHIVKDGDEVLTDKPLKTKKQVGAFLDKHLEDDDEE